MAVGYYLFDSTTHWGQMLRNSLNNLENGLTELNEMLGMISQMIDGDGSDDSMFTFVTARFGFPDNTTAHNAWNELNSLASKLNTDAAVTSVHAAMIQAFNKFR